MCACMFASICSCNAYFEIYLSIYLCVDRFVNVSLPMFS